MAKVVFRANSAVMTTHSKNRVAAAMMRRGMSFFGAALLIRKHGTDQLAVAHLLCQGLEVFAKGVFLLKDFSRHEPLLKEHYGHKLHLICDDLLKELGLKPLSGGLKGEVEKLSPLYGRHLLRYASPSGLLFGADYVASPRLVRRFGAGVRLARRACGRAGAPL